jgi:endonuclease III
MTMDINTNREENFQNETQLHILISTLEQHQNNLVHGNKILKETEEELARLDREQERIQLIMTHSNLEQTKILNLEKEEIEKSVASTKLERNKAKKEVAMSNIQIMRFEQKLKDFTKNSIGNL